MDVRLWLSTRGTRCGDRTDSHHTHPKNAAQRGVGTTPLSTMGVMSDEIEGSSGEHTTMKRLCRQNRRSCALLLVTLAAAYAETTTRQYTISMLDLSNKPHLSSKILSSAISDNLQETRPDEIELDVSSSQLGDDGIDLIMQSLRSPDSSPKIPVHVASRMNRLTAEGATRLLKDIGNFTSIQSLDLSFNDFAPDQVGAKTFHSTLRNLIEDPDRCPPTLRFERCGLGPAACRAIGKGMVNRFESRHHRPSDKPLSLHLCGNEAISDSGAATLAAAIRSAISSSKDDKPVVFDTLDLSSCGVGDAGVEALALALESYPGCIRRLDLSNNKISDDGAVAIAAALSTLLSSGSGVLESLNLSNNGDLGDRGASALAGAIEKAVLRSLSARSCKIRADGAQSIASALVKLSEKDAVSPVTIDLSGNPLGVLRGKDKSGKKYSASSFKSKASATTASYMNFIGKKIRSGLKDAGLDFPSSAASGESDDEEEAAMGLNNGSEESGKSDATIARCGAKAFASAIVVGEHLEGEPVQPLNLKCSLAVRHCFLDRGGADALAATLLQARERFGVELDIDARMNPVLEEDMVEALRGKDPSTLEEMSERHLAALESLREAEQRAAEAVAAAAERARQETAWDEDNQFGHFGGFGGDEEPDSDDYDAEGYY
jgi:Ran GTPase-activating protein (RanGAP) involved in mRNA processing and transport